jgi:hypothetical protein
VSLYFPASKHTWQPGRHPECRLFISVKALLSLPVRYVARSGLAAAGVGFQVQSVRIGSGRVFSWASVAMLLSREALGGSPWCSLNRTIGGRTRYFRSIANQNATWMMKETYPDSPCQVASRSFTPTEALCGSLDSGDSALALICRGDSTGQK